MLCKDVLDLIEPIASGDLQMDDVVRAHVETCPRCASALASARRLESMLNAVEVPQAPSAFTTLVLQRIRRDRWRSEQRVDRLFNLAIAAALLVIIGGVIAMLNLDAVFPLAATTWTLARESLRDAMKQAAPTLATYIAAAGLLASGFAMWWWAERRWEY